MDDKTSDFQDILEAFNITDVRSLSDETLKANGKGEDTEDTTSSLPQPTQEEEEAISDDVIGEGDENNDNINSNGVNKDKEKAKDLSKNSNDKQDGEDDSRTDSNETTSSKPQSNLSQLANPSRSLLKIPKRIPKAGLKRDVKSNNFPYFNANQLGRKIAPKPSNAGQIRATPMQFHVEKTSISKILASKASHPSVKVKEEAIDHSFDDNQSKLSHNQQNLSKSATLLPKDRQVSIEQSLSHSLLNPLNVMISSISSKSIMQPHRHKTMLSSEPHTITALKKLALQNRPKPALPTRMHAIGSIQSISSASATSTSVTNGNADRGKNSTPSQQDKSNNLSDNHSQVLMEQQTKSMHTTYKAQPVPDGIDDLGHLFRCGHCCDEFMFQSSLDHHLERKSIVLYLDCKTCKRRCKFYNKCTYHLHLKCHPVGHETNTSVTFDMEGLEKEIFAHKSPEKEVVIAQNTTLEMNNSNADVESDAADKASEDSADKVPTVSLPDVKESSTASLTKENHFKHTCHICGVVCHNISQYTKHFNWKHDKNAPGVKVKCSYCENTSTTLCSGRAHMMLHGAKSNVCPECGVQVRGDRSVFALHLFKCFHLCQVTGYSCQKCAVALSTNSKLMEHYMGHAVIYNKCLLCTSAFKSKTGFLAHYENVHPGIEMIGGFENAKKVFKCPFCNSVSTGQEQLKSHLHKTHIMQLTANLIRKYKCPMLKCGARMYNSKEDLMSHLLQHHQLHVPEFLCDICIYPADTVGEIHEHYEKKHPGEVLPLIIKTTAPMKKINLICQCCSLSHYDFVDYRKHVEENGIKIDIGAENALQFLDDLRDTKRGNVRRSSDATETDDSGKPDKPSKTSPSKPARSMKRKLEEAGSEVKPKLILKFHLNGSIATPVTEKSHKAKNATSEPKFTCPECELRFFFKKDLEQHMQALHDVKQQFPCQLCGLIYESKDVLDSHVKDEHEGRTKEHAFLCWICLERNQRKSYNRQSLLERHLISSHKLPRWQIDWSQMASLDERAAETLPSPARSEEKATPVKRLKVIGDNQFQCAKCSFSTEHREDFKEHMKKHKTENESHQCPECSMCFVVVPSLKRHLYMVHKVRDFSAFEKESGLELKEEKRPGSPRRSLRSPKPNGILGKEELNGNNGAVDLECNVCYKTYHDEASLRHHMRSHGMAFIRSKRSANL